MRLKQSSRSAFSNESGWVGGASLPSRYHSSMPQKWPEQTFRLRSFTRRATSGSFSVGPIGPAALDKLGVPDPERASRMPLYLEVAERLYRDIGQSVIVRGAGHGPYSVA